MSSKCKVLVSIRDIKGHYSPILQYDTMESAKRDFDAQVKKFPEEDRDDFQLCYYGFFDCDEGRIVVPSRDAKNQFAINDYSRITFDFAPDFSISPVKLPFDEGEIELFFPTGGLMEDDK